MNEILHLEGQTHQDEVDRHRTSLGGGGADRLDLVIVEARDDRRHVDTHWDAGARQLLDRLEPPVGGRGAGLERAGEFRVERGDRDVDPHELVAGELLQQVEVAQDARRLGDDAEGMARLGQHLDDAAGDPQPALERLIGVGVGAERERLRHVAGLGQLAAQELGGVGAGEDLGLEVKARRQAPDSCGWASRSSRCSRARSPCRDSGTDRTRCRASGCG